MSQLKIYFRHTPSSTTVDFYGFIETFVDSFEAEWSSDRIFGRMDPIPSYKGTIRKASLSFTVPSKDVSECLINHFKISTLLNSMYGTYESDSILATYKIASVPFMQVKLANLLTSYSTFGGVHCYIPSLKYDPDMNSQIFSLKAGTQFIYQGQKKDLQKDILAYQSFKISCELNIFSGEDEGFLNDIKYYGDNVTEMIEEFPYYFGKYVEEK